LKVPVVCPAGIETVGGVKLTRPGVPESVTTAPFGGAGAFRVIEASMLRLIPTPVRSDESVIRGSATVTGTLAG
jgi:hypothetical protein